ncbi:MAG: hypothetical protein QM541_10335 [Flavobacterium sp.]|nr:hypothetical protein [Flavobacterium sp.]
MQRKVIIVKIDNKILTKRCTINIKIINQGILPAFFDYRNHLIVIGFAIANSH